MPPSATHRFAILAALCFVCLVGAVALGKGGVSPESERAIAIVATVMSIALAGWLSASGDRLAVQLTAWLTGFGGAAMLVVPSVLRAGLAQLVFAMAVAVAVTTSVSWRRGPRVVEDHGVPSMRTLGWFTPLCVLVQVGLGAGLRYNALPVWPHVTGSMIVGGVLMFAGMAALQSYGSHDALKGVSTAMLWLTGLQLALGMAAYGVRMAAHPEAWTVYLTVAHVVAGAFTLGAATAFGLQVFYHVREKLLIGEAAA